MPLLHIFGYIVIGFLFVFILTIWTVMVWSIRIERIDRREVCESREGARR
jgi:Ca2+-dependent lipid-binding protein